LNVCFFRHNINSFMGIRKTGYDLYVLAGYVENPGEIFYKIFVGFSIHGLRFDLYTQAVVRISSDAVYLAFGLYQAKNLHTK
jgi:hypothetical protein